MSSSFFFFFFSKDKIEIERNNDYTSNVFSDQVKLNFTRESKVTHFQIYSNQVYIQYPSALKHTLSSFLRLKKVERCCTEPALWSMASSRRPCYTDYPVIHLYFTLHGNPRVSRNEEENLLHGRESGSLSNPSVSILSKSWWGITGMARRSARHDRSLESNRGKER